jgi:hypothetical protein
MALGVPAALLAAGACEIVAGLTDLRFEPGGAAGAAGAGGAATSSSGGAGGQDGCPHATVPPPPGASDPGLDDVSFVVAVRRVDFGETDLTSGPLVGYDLDGFCTCQGQSDSCKEPASAIPNHCDGPAGRDNATAKVLAQAATFRKALTSKFHTERAEAGEWTLLVRVDGYNGKPNDLEVRVAVYASPGRDADPCLSTKPKWDGTDAWPIEHVSLVKPAPGTGGAGGSGAGGSGAGGGPGGAGGSGGAAGAGGGCLGGGGGYDVDAPRYVDRSAYVTDGTLVANLPELAIAIDSDTQLVEVHLTAAFITGRPALDDAGRWRIDDGLFAGRWKINDVLPAIAAMLADPKTVCTDDVLYKTVKDGVCAYPDIASKLGGISTPCDALSTGIAFEAEQALLGEVHVGNPKPPGCPPETDPANDSCD